MTGVSVDRVQKVTKYWMFKMFLRVVSNLYRKQL